MKLRHALRGTAAGLLLAVCLACYVMIPVWGLSLIHI